MASVCRRRRPSKNSAAGLEDMAIDWQAFWLTLQLAAVVSATLFALGLPIAYWIAFSRRRWKFLVEAAVALPIVLPPTVLGFYVLVALGSRSPLGRWWQSLTGHTLAFTFAGFITLYALQRLQNVLPFNPQHLDAVSPDLAFNTSVSFVTNTNWQSYVPETTLSYLVEMAGQVAVNPVGRTEHGQE